MRTAYELRIGVDRHWSPALDRPGMLADAYVLHEFSAGGDLDIGPFRAQTRLLPHWVPMPAYG
jgi:hypothetical protein